VFFWYSKGIVLIDTLHCAEDVHADTHCATFERLHCAIQNCQWGLLTGGVFLFHDCKATLQKKREICFPEMKEFLGGSKMAMNKEVRESLSVWLNGLAADFFDEMIVKLVQRLGRCSYYKGKYI
jgi:hypothetical protein